jgi:hypothetical protein
MLKTHNCKFRKPICAHMRYAPPAWCICARGWVHEAPALTCSVFLSLLCGALTFKESFVHSNFDISFFDIRITFPFMSLF